MDDKYLLPDGWILSSIGDTCTIHTGYAFPNYLQGKSSGHYPFYKVGDISKNVQAGRIYLSSCENYVDDIELKILKAKLIPENTIVFAKVGAALKLNRRAVTKKLSLVDNNAVGVKANNKLLNDLYLYFFLRTVDMGDYSRETTIPSIRTTDIKGIPIPLPPLSEQKEIVARIEELFSSLEQGIKCLTDAKEKIKTYRQAVLRDAFEGLLTEKWRQTETSSEINKYISALNDERLTYNKKTFTIDSQITLSELPINWKWVCIGNITKGVEYGSSKKSENTGTTPVLRMGNIQNGHFDWTDLVYSSDNEEINKYLLRENDVLFNRTNSPELVGKTAIYNGDRPAIFAGYLIRLNQLNSINPRYLNYYLNSPMAQRYGNKVKTDGVNQSNINGNKLCNYPFPLCSKEEQARIVSEIEKRFTICDSVEKIIDANLQKAELLRQSILKQAFKGKLSIR